MAAPTRPNPDEPRPLRTPHELQVVKMLRWMLIAIFVVVGWSVVSTLTTILAPILVALTIAYLLDPLLDWMVAKGIKRGWGALILLLGFLGILITALSILIPMAIHQIESFVNDLPHMLDKAEAWGRKQLGKDHSLSTRPTATALAPGEWRDYIHSDEFKAMMGEQAGTAQEIAKEALGGVFETLGVLVEGLLIPVFAYYFLVDWDEFTDKVKRIIPPRSRGTVVEIFTQIDGVVSGWVRGQAIVTGLLAVLYAIAFSVIGIRLAVPIGVLVGLLTIVPFVGTFVGAGITLTLVLLDWNGPGPLIGVGVTFLVLHVLEAAVLTPKITGHKVGLSESGALFAVVAGGKLLGLVGMLLAVPIAATIAVLIRHAYRSYERSEFFGHEDDAIVPVTDAMAMVMPHPDAPGTRRSMEGPAATPPKDEGEDH